MKPTSLTAFDLRDGYEPPALEAALLAGKRSAHRPYDKATLKRIRKSARCKK